MARAAVHRKVVSGHREPVNPGRARSPVGCPRRLRRAASSIR
jgi:hypothetical protein